MAKGSFSRSDQKKNFNQVTTPSRISWRPTTNSFTMLPGSINLGLPPAYIALQFAPRKRLGRYEIRSQLGAGGMGEVYLAQDTKLDRKVALKILPPDLAANPDRMRRFVQEAKAAAALNHTNIAHVYEIGESADIHFIAMEFVDGQTLREKIHRDRVPLSKLLKYLIQVAEGLSKAHAAGIVHRDLNPTIS